MHATSKEEVCRMKSQWDHEVKDNDDDAMISAVDILKQIRDKVELSGVVGMALDKLLRMQTDLRITLNDRMR